MKTIRKANICCNMFAATFAAASCYERANSVENSRGMQRRRRRGPPGGTKNALFIESPHLACTARRSGPGHAYFPARFRRGIRKCTRTYFLPEPGYPEGGKPCKVDQDCIFMENSKRVIYFFISFGYAGGVLERIDRHGINVFALRLRWSHEISRATFLG